MKTFPSNGYLHRKRESRRLSKIKLRNAKRSQQKEKFVNSTFPALTGFRKPRENSAKAMQFFGNPKDISIKIPQHFSLIANPKESIKIIRRLVRLSEALEATAREIIIDYSKLEEFDIGADKVLTHVIQNVNSERKSRGKKALTVRGYFPEHELSRRFVTGGGLLRSLGVAEFYMREDNMSKQQVFSSDYDSEMNFQENFEESKKEKSTREFADHINSCLDIVDEELTNEGRNSLCRIVGEVLDNAEEHSRKTNWTIGGYLDSEDKKNKCALVIYNFGKSIAQTFKDLPSDHYTRVQISPYIDAHASKNVRSGNWPVDHLLTLVALQEKISSKNFSADDTRGYGTIHLIDFFQQMTTESSEIEKMPATMAIVSGNTHILFDGKYRLTTDEDGRRVIAFNSRNDLSFRPDRSYFTSLEGNSFPGTAVCIEFALRPEDAAQRSRNN